MTVAMPKILMQDEVYLRAIDPKQEKGGGKRIIYLPVAEPIFRITYTILARSAFLFNPNDNAIILYFWLDGWIVLFSSLPYLKTRIKTRSNRCSVLPM